MQNCSAGKTDLKNESKRSKDPDIKGNQVYVREATQKIGEGKMDC